MNREKFKQLSFKQKVQWLIQYYGVVTVIAIIAVIVAIFFLKTVFFPEDQADAYVLILSDDITADEGHTYEQELSDLTDEKVEVVCYLTSDLYSEASFAGKMSVDQIDLVIAPYNETSEMEKSGVIIGKQEIKGRGLFMSVPALARQNEHSQEIADYLLEKLRRDKDE